MQFKPLIVLLVLFFFVPSVSGETTTYYARYDGDNDFTLRDNNPETQTERYIDSSGEDLVFVPDSPFNPDKYIKLKNITIDFYYHQDENQMSKVYLYIQLKNQSGMFYNEGRNTPWNFTGLDGITTAVNEWDTLIDSSTQVNFWLEVHNLDHNFTVYYGDDTPFIVKINYDLLSGPIVDAGDDVIVEPNTEVQFTCSSSNQYAKNVIYEWDFNSYSIIDWTGNSSKIMTFIYNKEGTYTATITVTDEYGYKTSDSRIITVKSEEDDSTSISFTSIIFILITAILLSRRDMV